MGMYLRTTKRKNKDGTTIEYYQLAHNIRHPKSKNSVAQVIHSFGKADSLDKNELKRLCQSIARVCGLVVKDPFEEPQEELQSLPKDIKQICTREFGTIHAIETLWERLGIGDTLRNICKEKGYEIPYERALLAMTANRLCEPESKLGMWDRWLPKVYLPSCQNLKLFQMYEAMDVLYEHSEKIEETVFFHTANLLNLEVDLVFYDTTTVSFSIDATDCDDYRKLGHAKEGNWAPQVVVALAVTRDGLPVRSWVFPGNTSDVTTVEKVKSDLRGWNLGRILFVSDSGMNSEKNRKELSKGGDKYLMASRIGSVKEIKEEVLTRGGRYRVISDNLQAKEVKIGDGEKHRRYILCYNPRQAQREKSHRKEVIKSLEKEIKKHPKKEATAQWAIELLSSRRYKRYLNINNGKIQIDRESIRKISKYDGKWVLITNDDTISVEDAASGYKGLMVIERCFRSLKRVQIHMSPVHHWLSRRIESHVKICVFSLLIQRVAELECDQNWLRMKTELESLQVTEYHNKNFRFFQRNELKKSLKSVLKKLDIPLPKMVLGITDHNLTSKNL